LTEINKKLKIKVNITYLVKLFTKEKKRKEKNERNKIFKNSRIAIYNLNGKNNKVYYNLS
jgi:hypothetical protein